MTVLLWSLIVLLLSGVGAALLSRAPKAASIVGAFGSALGCAMALPVTLSVLLSGAKQSESFAWDSIHGSFVIGIDALSAFFLLPVLALSCLAAIYGFGYMRSHRRQENLGGAWLFYGFFVAGMILVLLARTTILFLIAWEVMSVAAFALVTFEHEKEEVRRAGWIYLVAAHIGVAALIAAFLLLGSQAESLDFAAFEHLDTLTSSSADLVFVFALIGFGTKAGLVPLHVWLPEAHPAAPSHVSALMSGVMIKMGIYGLLRFTSFLGEPAAWWGVCLAILGLLSGLVGISLAVSQRDFKRALAYSSIENIGLIVFSLGLGLWGISQHQPSIAVLGLTAALLHVWNHSAMKGLLFLAAGSVLHGTGTKDFERLGGLMKRLPWTSTAILIGSIAISALPPLNGFVSEWLMYLGLLKSGLTQTGLSGMASLLSISILAIIGTLAVITFGRVVGVVLLGTPRGDQVEHAHEASIWMLGPMTVLAVVCISLGAAPRVAWQLIAGVVQQVGGLTIASAGYDVLNQDVPLTTIGNMNLGLWIAVLVVFTLLTLRVRQHTRVSTWGCGNVCPIPRMQYTSRSFGELITNLLPRPLRPLVRFRHLKGLFPARSRFQAESPDPVRRSVYEPLIARLANRCVQLRVLQQGQSHLYLAYIILTVVVGLSWASVWAWRWGR
jgi:formate hydrogenlyase subunit 3/multisubunit Na+/H+ antiporter MnhD subunit